MPKQTWDYDCETQQTIADLKKIGFGWDEDEDEMIEIYQKYNDMVIVATELIALIENSGNTELMNQVISNKRIAAWRKQHEATTRAEQLKAQRAKEQEEKRAKLRESGMKKLSAEELELLGLKKTPAKRVVRRA